MIALCVTSIGFSIHKTVDSSLSWSQIPLALSIISWSLSIYLGIKFIHVQLSSLFTNNQLLDIEKGVFPLTGVHPEKIQMGIDTATKQLNKNSKIAEKRNIWQYRLLIIGFLCFITWHILAMYIRTNGL